MSLDSVFILPLLVVDVVIVNSLGRKGKQILRGNPNSP